MNNEDINNVKSERIKRGERYYNEIYPEVHKNKENDAKSSRGSKINKKRTLMLAIGASGLVIIGTPVVKNVRYQRDIDKANEAFVTNVPENISLSEEQREDTQKYLEAINTYLNDGEIDWKDKLEAENVIVEFMASNEGKAVAEKIAYAKINQAKLYGDYDSFNNSYDNKEEIYWINDKIENEKGFKINGIDSTIYSTKYQILSKKIPENLSALTEDILDYGDWKSKDDCLKAGVDLGSDIETVMCEYYLLDKNGNIKRVNEKDFNEKKGEYKNKLKKEDDKNREDFYEKYGIALASYTETENSDIEK